MGKWKLTIITFFLIGLGWGITGLSAQVSENVELLYQYDDPSLPSSSGISFNDVWGYVGPNGEEIAIIGTLDSILFFDVTDPNNVEKLQGVAPGGRSTWRDFKTYQNYLYGIIDNASNQKEGLTIINMDDVLAGNSSFSTDTSEFYDAHNVWIDTAKAKLYIPGSDTESHGLIVFDISDPANPTLFSRYRLSDYGASCSSSYVHDLHVRNDTAYCNMGSNCGFYVFDVSDSLPVVLGSMPSSAFGSGYNHSCWINSDGTVAAVAEETHGNPLWFVDISDPSDMPILADYKDPLLAGDNGNIVHNPFIKGDLCYVAYYHDGLQILDISDASNPVRVGYYDTDTQHSNYGGFRGAWGTYPYLPSGNILISDVRNGFFLVEPDASILAADWLHFIAEDRSRGQFYLSTEFQTSVDLRASQVQWSLSGREFYDLEELELESKGRRQYVWNGTLDRPTGEEFFVRLRLQETDGAISYSPIRRIRPLPGQANVVFPNPASDQVWISSSEEAAVCEIVDSRGQQKARIRLPSSLRAYDMISSWPSGWYVVQWRNAEGDLLEVQKLVVE